MTTAVLFLLSPVLVPVIELIPPEAVLTRRNCGGKLHLVILLFSLKATAPCLVLVGSMMMGPAGL